MNSSAEQLDAHWTQWLRRNIQIGADLADVHRILREEGFPDSAIARSLNILRPRDSAFQSGILPLPPLIQRNPPNLRKIGHPKLNLYTLDDCLSPDECAEIIALSNRHLEPSPLAENNNSADFRTSRTCPLSILDDPLVDSLDEKISRTLGIRESYGEGIQAQRYDVGQQYKAHWDCFEPGTHEFLRFAGMRGNRTWTFMVYLNEGMDGGATHFTEINQSVAPKLGMALLWNNLHPDGSPNRDSKHSGEPVTRGQKFIITKWFRILGDGPVFHSQSHS